MLILARLRLRLLLLLPLSELLASFLLPDFFAFFFFLSFLDFLASPRTPTMFTMSTGEDIGPDIDRSAKKEVKKAGGKRKLSPQI